MKIGRDDIIAPEDYARARGEHRARIRDVKQRRRVEVGPFITFFFENRQTMWHQIHEMLHIEKGGEEQIADELDAYNPLVPEGRDLRATMMIEIDDPIRRNTVLRRLGWVDETASFLVGDRTIAAEPLQETERNTLDGKTSSIHFLVFRFDDDTVAMFRDPGVRVALEVGHENYGHQAILSPQTREALASDFS